MMNRISVIIPVYNTGKYIKKCVDSVIAQNYENYEIIIVNDGSTDNSEEVIQDYVSKYPQIIMSFKTENNGLSAARNYGIRKATGDYICFVDSDDYLSNDLFEELKVYMEKSYDLIKYKLISVDEEGSEIARFDGPVFENKSGEEAFNLLYGTDTMLQPAWLYMYKKSFWDEYHFKYPVGKYHEDFAVTTLIMLRAKKVVSTDIYGYNYVQSSHSITRGNEERKKMQRALAMFEHYDYMIDELKNLDISKDTQNNLKIYYTNNIILKVEELGRENRKQYINEIRKRKMTKNIKAKNVKQLMKKIILNISITMYLKLR